ncbi:MAG: COX15/CtaA family protein [Planctomycetota bacterium]|nr:COX15/CtaA family protein [Planctomycetota bacterium]
MGSTSTTLRLGSRLPFRLAVATTVTTMLLVLFGASVTTMGAGMAVQGWLMPEGELTEGATYFLPLFPLDEWLRDPGTFVEHTHRMLGMVVGLLAIAVVAATHLFDRRSTAKLAAWIGLVAICIQGVLGGTRVLENSQHLAFLHGAIGQLVFAILCCMTLVLAPMFRQPPALTQPQAQSIAKRGAVAFAVVYGQVLLGAWLRHSVRVATVVPGHDELPFPMAAFMFHAMGAMFVLVVTLVLAKSFGNAKEASGEPRAARLFGRFELLLQVTFVVQFLLGTGALATLKMERTAFAPLFTSTLHLLVGSILLAAAAAAWIWGLRLQNHSHPAGEPSATPPPTSEAASA